MNIYESIAAIQTDVDFIGKDKTTQSGSKFKYRGVDQVLNTLHPLFARHKVFAVPEVLEMLTREERVTNGGSKVLYEVLKVKYTFYAEDGTSVSAVVVGEAMDSGDKVSNKCMSVAYKYACFQVLSIPTEETTADPDDTNESLAPAPRQDKPKSKPAEPDKTAQDANGAPAEGNTEERQPFPPESYKCAVCGKVITEKLFRQTLNKYGTPLCSAECKEHLVKTGDLLS